MVTTIVIRSFRGPPIELIAIELLYLLAIVILCALILWKTNEAYTLTKHKGIKYFRKIFQFLSITYFLRFILLILVHSNILTINRHLFHQSAKMCVLLIGFFSTLAILYMVVAATHRLYQTKDKYVKPIVYTIATVVAVSSFIFHTYNIYILVETVLLLVFISILVANRLQQKCTNKKALTQTITVYGLLCLFWVTNTFLALKHVFDIRIRLLLYLLSVLVFTWIYVRVRKKR